MHPRTQVHAELKGSSERKTYRVRQTTVKRVSSSENNISCYNTNEHQHRVRTETKKYISLFFFFFFLMLDLLLRFRGFNSPGYVGIQTATVNKQDYSFGHASKSYHIGAGRGAGKQHQSNKVDRGQDAGSHGSWAHFYPQTNLPIFFLWFTVDFPFVCGVTGMFTFSGQKPSLFIGTKRVLYQILFPVKYLVLVDF